ncbi:hypothetical protein SSX86_016203 [Deinandra increscens subsp. villosa]|uniref:Uncharacterized protein n=1 Tax=Deinandra increscens subsp. villosa TaxID=3103831 RepID=A0AAP0CZ75_9ASTR
MKQHLAHIKGDVGPCKKVPADVKFTMQGLLKEQERKSKRKTSELEDNINILDEDEEDDETQRKNQARKGKKPATSTMHPFFTKGTNDSTQPSIRKAMQTKERLHDADLALAMWFYDSCIPMNACNSPYFQIAIDKIATIGYGYQAPNYHALRVNLLKDAKTHVSCLIDSFRSNWIESGCTIMSDGWRDIRQRHLINFLVYCEKGISFIKSVDASNIENNSSNLCNLFAEIVEMVGPKNVVQIITDNVANYKHAGELLCDRYPSMTWSPCAAHCLNLVMKDVSELENVKSLITLASRVTVFIYNHKWPLNWLRQRPGWTEIIRPGSTRFGTSFIALKSLVDHKDDLQAMVVSNEFKKMLKMRNAIECKSIVLKEEFWNNCLITVKVMTPLLRLLRLCDMDEKPSMGYVYDGIASIHRAAYWLNPAFQYDPNSFCKDANVVRGVLDMAEKNFSGIDVLDITKALGKFRDAHDHFGRPSAVASRNATQPAEWWRLFGGEYPMLQTLAVRLLSQTASSSGCERNWSVFERIHTKRRNRLEHQRLNDLVFVHYNLRLQNRHLSSKRSYDPIDYECIENADFWVVEEEAQGELNINEIEDMLNETQPTTQTQGMVMFVDFSLIYQKSFTGFGAVVYDPCPEFFEYLMTTDGTLWELMMFIPNPELAGFVVVGEPDVSYLLEREVRTGASVANEEILGFTKLFIDERILDNISRDNAVVFYALYYCLLSIEPTLQISSITYTDRL